MRGRSGARRTNHVFAEPEHNGAGDERDARDHHDRSGTEGDDVAGGLVRVRRVAHMAPVMIMQLRRAMTMEVPAVRIVTPADGEPVRTRRNGKKCAKQATIRQAPSTPLLLMAPYRAPIELRQGASVLPPKCATQVRDTPVTLRPTGPLGMIVVQIRPDAAWRVVGAPLGDFANGNLSLADLFGDHEAAICSEMLATAPTSAARVSTVVAFLQGRLRPAADSVASRAAAQLRRDPTLRMTTIAAALDVSTRHLARAFQSAFGMSPKYFARLARIERIIRERQRGLPWAEIAYACGLADQAHLIREFVALVGERPTEFFVRSATCGVSLPGPFIVRPEPITPTAHADSRSLQPTAA